MTITRLFLVFSISMSIVMLTGISLNLVQQVLKPNFLLQQDKSFDPDFIYGSRLCPLHPEI